MTPAEKEKLVEEFKEDLKREMTGGQSGGAPTVTSDSIAS
jgi:hypothetical protein